MAQPIITVDRLSKAYRIGLKDQIPDTLVGAVTGLAKAPVRKFRQLRGLNTFGTSLQGSGSGELGAGGDTPADIVWALRDVSFEVQEGEVLGVIGRNGAGKSTLLKILSRITEPTSGRAVLRGRVSSLLEVGTGFHPELTGRDNVYMNGTILGMTKREIDAKFDAIVDFSGVEKFLDTPIKRFSSGMTVRLAFAVAAHLEPEILIVDEVLAVGDAEFQKKCMGKMQDVARGGRTVLFVSHNMQAVSTLTTHCLLFSGGKCILDDTPAAVIASYLKEGTAGEHEYSASPSSTSPRITSARVVTSEPGNVHVHGRPLTFEFDIHVPAPLKNGCFSFQIMDSSDTPVCHSWIFDSETPILRTPGTHRLVCQYPAPRLYMGRYSLTVHLAEGEQGTHHGSVSRICPFEVVMYGHERSWRWQPNVAKYLEEAVWTNSGLS